MAWPGDVDGDVFRRLEANGFDFSSRHWVDFNIDLENRPPWDGVIQQVQTQFPDADVTIEGGDGREYLLVRLFDSLTYEFVLRIQDELSKIAAPFGGCCDSWGVLG